MEQTNTQAGFYGLGIAPALLKILDTNKYTTPTPIQLKAIPVGIQGQDMVGIAQTGTGKTLAFTIPMLQRLAAEKGMGLVLLPTRELALQVEEVVRKFGGSFGLRTAVLIGGASMGMQLKVLRNKPHVIIATPGRLLDHMEQRSVKLDTVSVLVLDEADRMLDMGFAPQINRILAAVPKGRQTMLFSATMPAEISAIASRFMKTPLRIEVARAGTSADRVDQEFFMVSKTDKLRLLETVLTDYKGTVLVFSRTKHGAKKITMAVRGMGHTAAEIHSNRSLHQRREALDGFKSGKYRVLVATDIAARGIDVTGIELVVNFDLPDQAEDYVHRIGRTGRAGAAGRAISFATPDQRSDIMRIERLVRLRLRLKPLPPLPAARALPAGAYEREERPRFSGGRAPRPSPRGVGYAPRAGSAPRTGGGFPPRRPSGFPSRGGSDRPSGGRKPGGYGSRPGGRPKQGPKTYYGGMGV